MARRTYGKKPNHQRFIVVITIIVVIGFLSWRYYNSGNSVEPEITLPEPVAVPETPKPQPALQPAPEPASQPAPKSAPKLAPESAPVSVSEPAPVVVIPEPEPVSPAKQLLEEAAASFAEKKYITARDKLSDAVKAGLDSQELKRALKLVNASSDKWLFTRQIFENDKLTTRYKVKPGDRLVAIGKKYNIPYQFLMKINGIKDASRLRAGESIKVVNGPFHLVVDRSDFTMYVYLQGTLVRSYPVGLGKPGRQTPDGLWIVTPGKKQVNPGWPDSETGKYYLPNDPENPLGERWIGLTGKKGDCLGRTGFGIHGTIKPQEIGKEASRGCIRLHNSDVEQLFDMTTQGQTTVVIRD